MSGKGSAGGSLRHWPRAAITHSRADARDRRSALRGLALLRDSRPQDHPARSPTCQLQDGDAPSLPNCTQLHPTSGGLHQLTPDLQRLVRRKHQAEFTLLPWNASAQTPGAVTAKGLGQTTAVIESHQPFWKGCLWVGWPLATPELLHTSLLAAVLVPACSPSTLTLPPLWSSRLPSAVRHKAEPGLQGK